MTKYFLLITLFSLSIIGFSQYGNGSNYEKLDGEIYGQVLDSISKMPIEYATIKIFKMPKNEMVGGKVTDLDGNFKITNLDAGTYKIVFSFIGYNDFTIDSVVLNKNKIAFDAKKVYLASSTILEEVTVSGEKPFITYDIDKKVINVEDQNTTIGQTAVEVLENAPSITIDENGNIRLRGSTGFTLLINGIPTAMEPNDALSTIPASTIKEIEIITNPSAKFDAEGTGGIINIITKKSKLEGISLLVNGSGGTFNNYSGDVALNISKNNFIFNFGANYNNRTRPNTNESTRTIFTDSVTRQIITTGVNDWSMYSYGINGEIQWTPNNSHILIASLSYSKRFMLPYNDDNIKEINDGVLDYEYNNLAINEIDINAFSNSFFYQHNIKKNKEHTLTFKAVWNIRNVDEFNTNSFYNPEGVFVGGNEYTETGPSNFTRFNFDYFKKLKNKNTFETGLQSQVGRSTDIGKNYFYNPITGEFEFNQQFSSDVSYVRDIHAGYFMYRGNHKKMGYQLGLRAEYTYREINTDNFPDIPNIERLDLFPSAHFSFELKNENQILVNFTRRIERPRSWYFEPFITWQDPYSVRSGNPSLLPEYINSFELSWIKNLKKKKGFVTLESYARNVTNLINRISEVYEGNVLINRPYNVGDSYSLGLEPSINYKLTDIISFNTAANIFYYLLIGEIAEESFRRESFNWNLRGTATFALKNDWRIQFVNRYNSRTVSPQGSQKGYYTADASIRKSFAKSKYAFTLSGRNIFATERHVFEMATDNVQINSFGQPRTPIILLTFSLKLNNYQKKYAQHAESDDF